MRVSDARESEIVSTTEAADPGQPGSAAIVVPIETVPDIALACAEPSKKIVIGAVKCGSAIDAFAKLSGTPLYVIADEDVGRPL